MERCFNGAPCRTKGQFAEFSKRNTHQDYHSPLDASPVLADGVTLRLVFKLFLLTPIRYISGISRSVISGKKIQNLLFSPW